jgi:hypothetical protein
MDSRPPGLMYERPLFTGINIRRLNPRFDYKLKATAVSSSGDFIGGFGQPNSGILSWTNKTHYSICKISDWESDIPKTYVDGHWDHELYSYTQGVGRARDRRWPSRRRGFPAKLGQISCAALSDEHVIVGTDNGNLLMFSLDETNDQHGMFLCWATQGSGIERIVFSHDDDSLLVLSRVGDLHRAVVYDPSSFTLDHDLNPKLVYGSVPLDWHSLGQVVDATFSSDGTMAAFCTTHDNEGLSYIRRIRKEGDRWIKFGQQFIQIFDDDRSDSSSSRINGIALYKPLIYLLMLGIVLMIIRTYYVHSKRPLLPCLIGTNLRPGLVDRTVSGSNAKDSRLLRRLLNPIRSPSLFLPTITPL